MRVSPSELPQQLCLPHSPHPAHRHSTPNRRPLSCEDARWILAHVSPTRVNKWKSSYSGQLCFEQLDADGGEVEHTLKKHAHQFSNNKGALPLKNRSTAGKCVKPFLIARILLDLC